MRYLSIRLIAFGALACLSLPAYAQSGHCASISDPNLRRLCRAETSGNPGECASIRDQNFQKERDLRAYCKAQAERNKKR